jgi:signal transduction histidine kinase
MIDAAVLSVRPLADAKDLHVETVFAKGRFDLLADGARLQQVVLNLLTNAIKFTPSGGRIQVRLAALNGALRLQVSDTGQGISPTLLPHIFRPANRSLRNATVPMWTRLARYPS